jgi:hypothetical protein
MRATWLAGWSVVWASVAEEAPGRETSDRPEPADTPAELAHPEGAPRTAG